MDILVVGLRQGRAPLEDLEALRRPEVLDRAEQDLLALEGVREAVRLVTRHRVGFVLGVSFRNGRRNASKPGEVRAVLGSARQVLAAAVRDAGLPERGSAASVDDHSGAQAYRHLLRVALGLESSLRGETESLGHLRSAYAGAVEAGRSSTILNGVFHRVFRAVRRIRARSGLEVTSPSGAMVTTLADAALPGAPVSAEHSRALRAADSLVEAEVEEFESWRRERELSSSLVRLGRLLEVRGNETGSGSLSVWAGSSGPADAHVRSVSSSSQDEPSVSRPATRRPDDGSRTFRRRLLRAFTEIAAEAGDETEAAERIALFEQALVRVMDRAPADSRRSAARARAEGRVSLVGAGPGDEGLLTLAAVARLQGADVVFYDALVSKSILGYCRPDARLVPVGKRRGSISLPQAEIEAAMVRDARAGRAVVRLKGGDPFVFGRGGEEALAMVRAGVSFDVVPGVTSGVAAPAAAGIPLTHRGLSGSAAFLTAHDLAAGAGGERAAERLRHLARGADTLVLFMGGAELARARTILIEAGLSPRTPAALIESATTAEQRVVTGRLENLDTFENGGTGGPVIIVIGQTVALAETLREGGRKSPRRPGTAHADRRAG